MVAYQPPDSVLIAVGAAQRVAPLLSAGRRITPLLRADAQRLEPFGIGEDVVVGMRRLLNELEGMRKNPRLLKNDNPVQMTEVPETMARIRAWLRTLRLIAGTNLTLDTPALQRLCSPAPEMAEGYPRDLLEEFKIRLKSAADLKPRLEEVGLEDAFLGRGRKLRSQLETAIGKQDIDGANLSLELRRFYSRKAQLYVFLKRIQRAAQLTFMLAPRRAALYHLEEIEPRLREPPKGAVRPRRAPE